MLLAALQFVEWSRSLGRKLRVWVFFFFLLFLASKNYGSRASKRAKGRLIIFFPLSFFSFKYLLHTRGKKKKTKMAERTACKWGAKKKGGGKAGGVAVRARTASNAELKREGGEGQREAALDRNPSSGGFRKGTFQQPAGKREIESATSRRSPPLRRAGGCPAPGGAARPRQPLSVPGAFPAPSCAWEEEASNGVYPCSSRPGQPTNKRDRFIAAQAGRRWVLCPPQRKEPQPHGPARGPTRRPATPGRGRAGPAGPSRAEPPPSLGAAPRLAGDAPATPARRPAGRAASTKQPSQTGKGYFAL